MGFGMQPYYEAPGNLQVGHVECAPLAISYYLIFFCIFKVSSMFVVSGVSFTVKNDTL